jgi:cytochrome c-type biogenesis protein CcmH
MARAARSLVIVWALALAFAGPAPASDRHPTQAELEAEVMCPTCQSLLELSHSPIAERERSFIRTRIAEGDSKSEIKAKLVEQFGEGILAAPTKRGFNLVAWLLPLFILVSAGCAVSIAAWHWTRSSDLRLPAGRGPPEEAPALDSAIERRLDLELARFDA